MSFFLSKIIGFVTSPLVWIIVGLAVTFVLWLLKSKATKIWFLITFSLSLLFTNPLLVNTLFHYWEKYPEQNITKHTHRQYDFAIVLSGMVSKDAKHNQYNFAESSDRILEAARLFHQNKVGKIIITGGNASIHYEQPPEAAILKSFLSELGLPDSCIIAELKARNTYENALYSSRIPELNQNKNSRILLITSAYHMPRAEACFRKQNITFTAHPVDFYVPFIKTDFHSIFVPSILALEKWNILLHEWIGFFYYTLMGYI